MNATDPMATVAEDFETKVRAAETFITHIGTRRAAEYIVRQQETIDAQGENIEKWRIAWKEVYSRSLQ